jgi:hypothetical protein
MGVVVMVTVANDVKRAPIWPLIVAPFACFVYYFLIRTAFLQSIEDVLGKAPSNVDNSVIENFAKLLWGSHWIYRCVAEYIFVTIAVFIAGGLAPPSLLARADEVIE